MRIWQLKALSLSSPHWKASTYQGNVIVRAETEVDARRLASQSFWIVTEKIPLQEVPANPWSHSWLVAAKVLEGSQYDPDGEEKILYPPDAPERGDG